MTKTRLFKCGPGEAVLPSEYGGTNGTVEDHRSDSSELTSRETTKKSSKYFIAKFSIYSPGYFGRRR